jgi:hypothetical protein
MEAVSTPAVLVNIYRTIWRNIPEDSNLISYIVLVKLSHYQLPGSKEERRCSSYLLLTLALDGVHGQHYALATFIPRN